MLMTFMVLLRGLGQGFSGDGEAMVWTVKESVVRKEEEDIYMPYNRTPVCVLDGRWAHWRRGLSCRTDARLTAVTHDHTRECWIKQD